MAKQPGLNCEATPTAALPYMLGSPLTGFTTATVVVTLRAGDAVVPPDGSNYGSRKIALAAQFTVNAAGRVEQCASADSITVINQPLDVCALISAAQTDTAPAFAPGTPRRGAFGFYVYGTPRPATAEPPTAASPLQH